MKIRVDGLWLKYVLDPNLENIMGNTLQTSVCNYGYYTICWECAHNKQNVNLKIMHLICQTETSLFGANFMFSGVAFVYRDEECGFCTKFVAARSDVPHTTLYWSVFAKCTSIVVLCIGRHKKSSKSIVDVNCFMYIRTKKPNLWYTTLIR